MGFTDLKKISNGSKGKRTVAVIRIDVGNDISNQ